MSYEWQALTARALAAVDPDVDQISYEAEVLAAHSTADQRNTTARIRPSHSDLSDDVDMHRIDPYWDQVSYERQVLVAHAQAAVDPDVDQTSYEAEVLATSGVTLTSRPRLTSGCSKL